MKKELTCIVCPMGCRLTVELDGGEIRSVTGNTCPRGKQYAIDECTHPMRTVTSTARASDGAPVAVKTDRAIPKELMIACMEEINRATVTLPAQIGDIVIENLLGTGVNVIVTANRK
ncbi:MAG: DUF1667 domain-containing protein [Clostridia bacterium]|nr:DUF1667 domain-containing protein [Clostridia bacterium]